MHEQAEYEGPASDTDGEAEEGEPDYPIAVEETGAAKVGGKVNHRKRIAPNEVVLYQPQHYRTHDGST